MRFSKFLPRYLFVFFTFLLALFIFENNTLNVKAVSDQSVQDAATYMSKYDGITNWKLRNGSGNSIGSIPIGGNVSLGYTFGAARDSSNNVKGGDTTLTTNSTTGTVDTAPTINNSKINIFLNNNGKYYGVLHQGDKSYNGDSSATPQKASDTSIDFSLLTGGTLGSNYYSGMNLMAKATYKSYYTGTDANGRLVLKIAGYYSPRASYFEVVLRPSITGAPVVSRELYVYNNSGSSQQFQTFYGEDTGLSPNMDTAVDNVPMYAIGKGEGLYLLSDLNYSPASKLFVTNSLTDGFKDFMGRV